MAAIKQHDPNPTGYPNSSVGKQHAITVEIEGCVYQPSDMVPRQIALKIAQLHNTDFSTAISKGRITPEGYGKNARFKVSECIAVAMSKRTYSRSINKAA